VQNSGCQAELSHGENDGNKIVAIGLWPCKLKAIRNIAIKSPASHLVIGEIIPI
jgi:hypothetical protein